MKVLLFALNGSWAHSNLAIRCLRAPLEQEGFSVTLAEYTLRDRTAHILEHLHREAADVYGFSCYIWNLQQTLALAEALKILRPSARIVLGGPEVSYGTERFSELNFIDAIVCGEGEEAMLRLCQSIRDGKPFERIVEGTPSSAWVQEEGMLYRTGEQTGGILYYESSRGCPYSCAYCLSSATKGVRFKSVAKTLGDLEAFERADTDCRIIKLVDRTFNADVARANAIWRALLDEKYTKHYHFEVCASLLDEESFAILSAFPKGKIQLEFGLQSTNEKTLAAVSRHLRPEAVIEAVRRIHQMGNIHVHLDLIAGLPYESYARFAESFDAAYGCCDLLQVGFLKLLHGTALRERAEEYGYRFLPYPPYTVLENKWISYAEMQRLSHMAETLERYLESGRFTHTLYLITPYMRSPFRFWEGLTAFLKEQDPRPLQKLSQPDAFRYLLAYAEREFREIDPAELRRMLCADFSMHEHKNPPAFLSMNR